MSMVKGEGQERGRRARRILGMSIVPNANHGAMVQMCKDLVASQAKLLRGRAVTDKIALFTVRAVMMPALTYKMQGHAFTSEAMHDIFMPLMHGPQARLRLPHLIPELVHAPPPGWLARCRDSRQCTRRTT